jgi:hypothetical protein
VDCTRDSAKVQEQIDAIRRTLDQAKAYSGLGSDDPALIVLEEIMLAKIANLETAKNRS